MLICLAFSVATVLNFVLLHWDVLFTFAGALVYAVKATKWGKANSRALATVAAVIENLNHTEIKEEIKSKSAALPKAVVDAIEDAVRKADIKQDSPTAAEIVKREALRGITGPKE